MRLLALAVFLGSAAASLAAEPESSWRSIGPDAGTLDFVAAAPSSANVVYASSKLGGVFRSVDGGSTWDPSVVGVPAAQVQCLAVAPNDEDIVYAGGREGAYKSTDGGASWTALGGGFPPALVNSIVVDPSNPSTVYATGTTGALVKSTDAGATWSAIGGLDVPAAAQPRILAIAPGQTSKLYLGTLQGGVFRSDDGGASWTAVNSGLKDQFDNVYAVAALAVDPANSARVFAGTAGNGVFLTTDSGAGWTLSSDGIGQFALVTGIVFAADGTAFLSQQLGLYERAPGAAAWTAIHPQGAFVSDYINAIALGPPPGSTLYLVYGKFPFDSGGFASFDGSSMRYSNVPVLVVTSLAADPESPGRALAAATGGAAEYVPGSASGPWAPVSLGTGGSGSTNLPPISLFFDVRTPGLVYAGAAGAVARSTDGGRTTASSATVGDPTVAPRKIVRCFVAQPGSSQGVLAGTSAGLYLSSDGGASWSAASTDLAARQIYALSPDFSSPSTLWAGTDDGVYRSTDSGGGFARAGNVGSVVRAVLAARTGKVVAGADSGLFTSSDGGTTWLPAPGVAAAAVDALAEDPATGRLYAGGLAGVYRSDDGGASWVSDSAGLANPNVLCLALLGNGSVLAGTNGASVFLAQNVRTAPRGAVSRAEDPRAPHAVAPRP